VRSQGVGLLLAEGSSERRKVRPLNRGKVQKEEGAFPSYWKKVAKILPGGEKKSATMPLQLGGGEGGQGRRISLPRVEELLIRITAGGKGRESLRRKLLNEKGEKKGDLVYYVRTSEGKVLKLEGGRIRRRRLSLRGKERSGKMGGCKIHARKEKRRNHSLTPWTKKETSNSENRGKDKLMGRESHQSSDRRRLLTEMLRGRARHGEARMRRKKKEFLPLDVEKKSPFLRQFDEEESIIVFIVERGKGRSSDPEGGTGEMAATCSEKGQAALFGAGRKTDGLGLPSERKKATRPPRASSQSKETRRFKEVLIRKKPPARRTKKIPKRKRGRPAVTSSSAQADLRNARDMHLTERE